MRALIACNCVTRGGRPSARRLPLPTAGRSLVLLLLLTYGAGRAGATEETRTAKTPSEAASPPYTHDELIDVPEPLLFDLIRRPDGHRGELEFNTLLVVPLRGRPRVGWSPEVEYTFTRGHSVELEVDVDHDRVERLQLAFQGTFNWSRNERFIHGWQMLNAYDFEERAVSVTGLYMFAVRYSRRVSSWVLVGGRYLGANRTEEARGAAVINPSVYVRLRSNVILAVESNLVFGPGERVASLLGEVEWDITPDLQFQIGIGPRWENGRAEAFLALRLTWDRE